MATATAQKTRAKREQDDETNADEVSVPTPRPREENGKADGPLLDLSVIVKRPTITVASEEHPDGYVYELQRNEDFGIIDQHEMKEHGAEFDRLWNKSTLNGKDRQRLKFLLDKMFDRVLIAPAEVKDQLTDMQRREVILVFTQAPLLRQMRDEQIDGLRERVEMLENRLLENNLEISDETSAN